MNKSYKTFMAACLFALLSSSALAQSSGIAWKNGNVLTAQQLQQLDNAKMNISSLGKPGFAPKLNALGQITDPVVGDVSGATSISANTMWVTSTIQNYDGSKNPSAGQIGAGDAASILPQPALPCYAIQQSYIMASGCMGSVFTNALESYAYSFGSVNLDDGTLPSSYTTNTSASDKVTMYVSGDQRSTKSNLWGLNILMAAHPDSWNSDGSLFSSMYGLEMDIGNGHSCVIDTDSTGTSDCPGNMGLWITGESLTGQPTGPAVYITSGNNTPMFDDGIIMAGNSIRDTGIYENTNSGTAFKVGGTHSYGLNLSGAKYTTAAISLASGSFWGDDAQYQGIKFSPPNGVGATDWIIDTGNGLYSTSTQAITAQSPYTYEVGTVVHKSTGPENYMVGEDAEHAGGIGVDFSANGSVTDADNDWSFLTMTAGKYIFSLTDGSAKYDLLTIKNGSISTSQGTSICLDASCAVGFSESVSASGAASLSGALAASGTITGTDLIASDTTTPTSSTTCTRGAMHSDDTYLYVCTSARTYKKIALSAL